jgi:hypothetical protein
MLKIEEEKEMKLKFYCQPQLRKCIVVRITVLMFLFIIAFLKLKTGAK